MSESAKKGKLVTKIFFSDNAEWMYLLNFYKKYIASKLEIQCKNGMFFFDFGWCSVLSILILSIKNRGWWGGGGAKRTKSVKHDESYLST